ncbi:MAG: hypothetical protein ABW001_13210 [Mycobacterium sp.]
MTAPAEPHIVVEVGGLAVAEHGPLILLVDRGTGSRATLAFVLGVLAMVLGGFGLATLLLTVTGGETPPWWLGAIFLFVGIAFAGAACTVASRMRAARTRPLSSYRPVAVFDRARRVFLDADGDVVAHLDQIRIQTRTQMTSSSPALVASTPAGIRILKRGNPFNGGVGDLDTVLNRLLFGQPR